MSYLARLKAEVSGKCLPTELTKPTKAPWSLGVGYGCGPRFLIPLPRSKRGPHL
jgi:hypothetical protein